MLYPLSYEGLRFISYLPGRSQECPGVPSGAHRCHLVHRWGSVAGRSASGATSRIRILPFPVMTAGAQR
jgi:hypothetical protein